MSDQQRFNPVPQGLYKPAIRWRDQIFTSGMTPRENGILVAQGVIGVDDPLDRYRQAVVLACQNAIAAAQNLLAPGEEIAQVLSMTVFLAADAGFQSHSKVADFASDHLFAEFGQRGIGSRAAIGVASLPGNAPVEIQLTVAAGTRSR
ncbi:RidA family protein [Mesorhizobium sp. M7A.F.Ca.US.006.01.1.1]|uniref:RidA family protein n=1 Tax=Mesorhizobium sp. M7A.F.Ca.US.006.01.1.1 TaxID=2496707 RepID=UPI000FCB7010|nr:RidA family protein [Mesorhizobium sp. M7A.F.Ca.US.006.01.1.1]RUZ75214.1 RidA family protein [Mesorhizobium sp. M7A.F.Ca.US.006.01.1.1]